VCLARRWSADSSKINKELSDSLSRVSGKGETNYSGDNKILTKIP
jgi:hypothetical protein